MHNIQAAIVGLLCLAAVGARAQSFEQQLFQIGQKASVTAQQGRQAFLGPNAQAAAVQGQNAWQKVAGHGNTFALEMPAVPTYAAKAHKGGAANAPFTTHEYMVNTHPHYFQAYSTIYPPEIDCSDPGLCLQQVMNSIANTQWTDIAWVKHQGHLAADVIGIYGDEAARVYIVMRGQQVIRLHYFGPAGTARSADAERFIASLNIR